jgi:hypothetical protein
MPFAMTRVTACGYLRDRLTYHVRAPRLPRPADQHRIQPNDVDNERVQLADHVEARRAIVGGNRHAADAKSADSGRGAREIACRVCLCDLENEPPRLERVSTHPAPRRLPELVQGGERIC